MTRYLWIIIFLMFGNRADAQYHNCTLIGQWVGGPPHGLAVSDHHLYIPTGGMFEVVDCENWDNPHIIGSCSSSTSFFCMAMQGNFAYIAGNNSTFLVVDASDLENPHIIADLDLSPDFILYHIVARESYVYLTSFDEILIIDISIPASPLLAGVFSVDDRHYAMAKSENILLVTAYDSYYETYSLHLCNLAVPDDPQWISEFNLAGYPRSIAVDGNTAYVSTADCLQLLDISDPEEIELLGSLPMTGGSISLGGNHAFIANDSLYAIDISDELEPALEGSCSVPAICNWVVVEENVAYVTYREGGIGVIDVSEPSVPSVEGSFETPGKQSRAVVDGEHVYLANRSGGLRILNTADPTLPEEIGSLITPGETVDLALNGGTAYLADGYEGLTIADISDPYNPSYLGGCVVSGYAQGVAVHTNLVVIADSEDDAIHLISVSAPENPAVLDTYYGGGWVGDVEIQFPWVYAWFDGIGLEILDISSETTFAEVGEFASTYNAYGITEEENRLYIAANNDGVLILDIIDPINPVAITQFDADGFTQEVGVIGDIAYVAVTNYGLAIFDISNPSQPNPIGSADTGIWGVCTNGEYAFVSAWYEGLKIIRSDLQSVIPVASIAHNFILEQNYPNPFNPATTISYQIPETAFVNISVYNTAGQLVKTLVNQYKNSGFHTVEWNASNISSGVYFYTLTAGEFVEMRKCLVVK